MAIRFNADEIFEMAEEIEANASKFYKQAAYNTKDEEIKAMLLDLSEMENEHLNIFRDMRKEIGEEEKSETVYDPDDEGMLYLQSMADSHGWEGQMSKTEKLTGNEPIQDVLKSAIRAEKDSVVFYAGLKSLVSARAGAGKVDKIIKEELSHITKLSQKLRSL